MRLSWGGWNGWSAAAGAGGGGGALARVQGTGKGTSTSGTVALTFASPPSVGNGILVAVGVWWTIGPTIPTCADNRGNTYSTALSQLVGTNGVALYVCPAITATGAPFTVTLSGAGAGTSMLAAAIDVSGVGTGLVVDRTAYATSASTTPATGATAALTGSEVVTLALHIINANQASITVAAGSPTWTEEAESLVALAGEIDSRVLTAAAGTTTSASWTAITSSSWWAALVACKAGT